MPRYTTYSTGTVTATNGSRTVTGVNTAWMVASTQEFQVVGGDLLRIGNQRPVVIDTVDSPTQITLVENWPHSTASASAYTIIRYATPPEARVLGALETLAQRGSSTSPFERITFDSGGVRFQTRDDGSGLVGLYIGATGTADGSLTLAETINRTTLARILRGPLSWTGTTYMGLLIQSLTTAQRDALSSPGNGGIIYNSTLDRHQFRAGGAWHEHVRRGGDTMTGLLTVTGLASTGNVTVTGGHSTILKAGSTLVSGSVGALLLKFSDDNLYFDNYDGDLIFRRGSNAVSMVLKQSGNVGIGTTSPSARVHAVAPTSSYALRAVSGSSTLDYSEFGGFAYLWNAGSTLITGVLTNHDYSIQTNSIERLRIAAGGHITPGADNTQNLGSGSLRMATIFAGTGTINTSDAREKDNILPITDALLDKWAHVEAISFKFKGRNRTHFGYTAQQVLECMGEDAWTYALLCKDAITKPVKRTVTKLVQKTETKTVSEETIEIKDGVPTIVIKTRETQEPVVEMVAVIGADGKPGMVERQIEVDGEPETIEREIEVPGKPDKDGNPTVKKKTVKETITPKINKTIQEPRMHPVPVMVESEVEETVDEPAGDRLGLRYDQCAVIEAAWTRRELSRALARIAAMEAA
jgi:hypothetical protein